ncbi:MmgE/PrpD family protein [Haloglomus litoreum]|uniref:MmgE/PrpD family protein n=1 Tax=Haloglomus litoreum TaxID=3034026 RepID=UPI0023E7A12A|nr:MmgE/PrpD family protein [Haloglomus sp. DT116]
MPSETTPSAALASFLTELQYAALPDRAVRLAERCFVDTVGVTLAGAQEGAGAAAHALARADGSGPATLLGREGTAPRSAALLANGTAGHGLDFDDVSWGMDGHPSVTLVAPALAVGETVDATGRELLTAFVAGFETECHLASAISPGHYERGWHATSTFGVFGAAAVAARLLGATEPETRHALNTAASFAAGLKRNFGSMTKPLHVGGAVRAGVTAATLAAEGFTADATTIGGDRGFWDLYAGSDGVGDPAPLPPDRWALLEDGVHVKKYPSCYFTHTSIANAVDLAATHDLAPGDIERVHVRASQGALDALAHDDPTTGLEAKFSLSYTVAAGLVRGEAGLAAFEDDAWTDPAVDAVRKRVTYEADPDLHYDAHESHMRIETAGAVHERTRTDPPGTHEDPLDRAELREKYETCARRALPEPAVERTWAALDDLRSVGSTATLLDEF